MEFRKNVANLASANNHNQRQYLIRTVPHDSIANAISILIPMNINQIFSPSEIYSLQSSFEASRPGLESKLSGNVFLRLIRAHDLPQQCTHYSEVMNGMECGGI